MHWVANLLLLLVLVLVLVLVIVLVLVLALVVLAWSRFRSTRVPASFDLKKLAGRPAAIEYE